jgi:serralysin
VGGSGRDRLIGGSGWDRLTGGPNGDRLDGGSGRNSYDAGSGNDYVNARNRRRERVLCGRGRDRARVDRNDRVRNCERVQRPR